MLWNLTGSGVGVVGGSSSRTPGRILLAGFRDSPLILFSTARARHASPRALENFGNTSVKSQAFPLGRKRVVSDFPFPSVP